jgi:Bacterial regulatory helix-turn-helix protein, lysR family
MELRHLRYFVAVAEALNFTQAAVRLRVTQSALSRQVQALEDEIGGSTQPQPARRDADCGRKIISRRSSAVASTRGRRRE